MSSLKVGCSYNNLPHFMIPDKLVVNAMMPEIIKLKTAKIKGLGSPTSPTPENNVKKDRMNSKTADIDPIRRVRRELEL